MTSVTARRRARLRRALWCVRHGHITEKWTAVVFIAGGLR